MRRSPSLSILSLFFLLNAQLVIVPGAQAALASTGSVIAGENRSDQESRIRQAFRHDGAARLLADYGLTPDRVDERLQRLSDAEITRLAEQADRLPAGGDGLDFVLVVFLVLLFLELLGAIDIFPRI